jgi:1,4-alpha-glucan branching enzyme
VTLPLRRTMTRATRFLAAALAVSLAAVAIATSPSARPGVGAIFYPGGAGQPAGTTFRTWAPNASGVRVAGTFNGWNATSHPLYSEGNGWWSVDVDFVYPGAQYKFVIVRPGGSLLWKNDPRARRLTSSVGNSIVYKTDQYQWQANSFQMPAWNDLVIYELHPGTFHVPDGTPPGTFDDIKARLDSLVDLGVNAIQMMPVAEFAGDLSWGYNPAHPFAVESSYGGPDEFKELIDAAHARGLAVFSDLVFNHLGPSDLDLWQFDGWSQNGLGGIFFYNDFRAYTPWGDTRPDFGRGEVRSYIRDNVLMWLEEFRLDGHRMDGTKFIRRVGEKGPDIPEGWSLLQWINDSVDASQPWKFSIAEDLGSNEWISKPTGAGGAGFDSQWDARFFWPIRNAVIVPNDADRSMWAVRDAIAASYNGQALQRVIYTESHDEVANGKKRVPEEISPGDADSWWAKKRSTLGAFVTFTSPGVPMLFMGQEFLEDGWFADTDPLDWSKATTFAGIRSMYRDLIRLRRDLDGKTRGLKGPHVNVHHVNDSLKVLAWHRWENGGAGDDTIMVANFSAFGRSGYRIGVPRAGQWKVRFNSDWNGYDPAFSNWGTFDATAQAVPWDGLSHSIVLGIGPYTGVVLSQEPPVANPNDLNGDGKVNAADLAILLGNWGLTPATPAQGDLDGNQTVNAADLARLLAAWAP